MLQIDSGDVIAVGMGTRRLYLVVARGGAAGARLRLDEVPRVVGRARDADLVLPDVHISRRHLRVSESNGSARLEVLEGAKPLLVNGAPLREVLLSAGDGIVIGETAVVVVAEEDAPDDARSGDAALRTDVRTLMTGVAADVRGLATIMELVDSLDATSDEASIAVALRAWGADHLVASNATLERGDTDPALRVTDVHPRPVVERVGSDPATTLLSAPVHGAELAWLTFTCAVRSPEVTGTMRRLAAVAGRLTAVALARMSSLRRAEEDREAFRRASLGSARSFLGDSAAAVEVSKLVPRLAASDALVLLEGETGVGKTFLARLIHEGSARAKEPLRVINCAAIPDTLIESELFGHERGAFTGATSARAGALESAGRGTLLLDEIGELPLASQAKLLRVLEEKRFERLGSNRALQVEARVLTATNRDLVAMVEEGTFRRDLYYRVAVVKLRVPPLRDRGDDLVLLAERVLADLAPQAGRRVEGFSSAAMDAIRKYPWPGNVRELKNAIERALVVGEGRLIEPGDLPETVHGAPVPQPTDESLVRLPAKIEWLEARAIEAALRATGGNQSQAAVLLGISRNTLRRKLNPTSDGGGG
jgi:DNA-binding NtrC family response regulator